METKEIINSLKYNELIPEETVREIIKRLEEHDAQRASLVSTTKKMIEYLELNKLSNGLSKQDDEITWAIIKTLQDHDDLLRALSSPEGSDREFHGMFPELAKNRGK